MIRVRSRLEARQAGEHAVMVHVHPRRRILYGAMALLLGVAALFGFAGGDGFQSAPPVGIVLFSFMLLSCVAVAAYDRRTVFDKQSRSVKMAKLFAGFAFSSQTVPLDDVRAVVLQIVRLLRRSELPPSGRLGGSRAAQRGRLFRLGVETTNGIVFLEDSADQGELETIGQGVAEFIGIDYRVEEL